MHSRVERRLRKARSIVVSGARSDGTTGRFRAGVSVFPHSTLPHTLRTQSLAGEKLIKTISLARRKDFVEQSLGSAVKSGHARVVPDSGGVRAFEEVDKGIVLAVGVFRLGLVFDGVVVDFCFAFVDHLIEERAYSGFVYRNL